MGSFQARLVTQNRLYRNFPSATCRVRVFMSPSHFQGSGVKRTTPSDPKISISENTGKSFNVRSSWTDRVVLRDRPCAVQAFTVKMDLAGRQPYVSFVRSVNGPNATEPQKKSRA